MDWLSVLERYHGPTALELNEQISTLLGRLEAEGVNLNYIATPGRKMHIDGYAFTANGLNPHGLEHRSQTTNQYEYAASFNPNVFGGVVPTSEDGKMVPSNQLYRGQFEGVSAGIPEQKLNQHRKIYESELHQLQNEFHLRVSTIEAQLRQQFEHELEKQLEKKRQYYVSQVAEMSQRLLTATNESTRIQIELQGQIERYGKLDEQCTQLKDDVRVLKCYREALGQQLTQAQRTIADSEALISELSSRLSQTQESAEVLKQYEAIIQQLKEDIGCQDLEKDRMQEELTTLNSQVNRLRERLLTMSELDQKNTPQLNLADLYPKLKTLRASNSLKVLSSRFAVHRDPNDTRFQSIVGQDEDIPDSHHPHQDQYSRSRGTQQINVAFLPQLNEDVSPPGTSSTNTSTRQHRNQQAQQRIHHPVTHHVLPNNIEDIGFPTESAPLKDEDVQYEFHHHYHYPLGYETTGCIGRNVTPLIGLHTASDGSESNSAKGPLSNGLGSGLLSSERLDDHNDKSNQYDRVNNDTQTNGSTQGNNNSQPSSARGGSPNTNNQRGQSHAPLPSVLLPLSHHLESSPVLYNHLMTLASYIHGIEIQKEELKYMRESAEEELEGFRRKINNANQDRNVEDNQYGDTNRTASNTNHQNSTNGNKSYNKFQSNYSNNLGRLHSIQQDQSIENNPLNQTHPFLTEHTQQLLLLVEQLTTQLAKYRMQLEDRGWQRSDGWLKSDHLAQVGMQSNWNGVDIGGINSKEGYIGGINSKDGHVGSNEVDYGVSMPIGSTLYQHPMVLTVGGNQ